MRIENCCIIEFPKITDAWGNLAFIEGGRHIPFDIRRVFCIYDIPAGAMRGGHAHTHLEEVLIAMSGSFDVVLDDGASKRKLHLDDARQGLYICPMIWKELGNFSPGSICLCLASTRYDEGDYIRNYPEFLDTVRNGALKNLPPSIPGEGSV